MYILFEKNHPGIWNYSLKYKKFLFFWSAFSTSPKSTIFSAILTFVFVAVHRLVFWDRKFAEYCTLLIWDWINKRQRNQNNNDPKRAKTSNADLDEMIPLSLKSEKWKTQFQEISRIPKTYGQKLCLNCYGPMHYHLPSHVLFFELIGIPYLYEVSVEKKMNPSLTACITVSTKSVCHHFTVIQNLIVHFGWIKLILFIY